jgi:hypothetical protein
VRNVDSFLSNVIGVVAVGWAVVIAVFVVAVWQ